MSIEYALGTMSIECALDEPRLPPELEHKIFKIAALARPIGIRTLMLVAKRVKFWVEPVLYRVVYLNSPSIGNPDNFDLPAFAPDALEQISPDCLRHVRHLYINDTFVEGRLQSWLLACSGVTNLCALFACTPDLLPSISGFTNIKYLTIDVRALDGTKLPLPTFLTVTHLELLDLTTLVVRVDVDRVFSNISLMPRLTHIAINPNLDKFLPHEAFCANAELRCILFFNAAASLDDSPLLNDSRFVHMDDGETYCNDWLHGTVFGRDYWSVADDFLAARRAGTIDRSRYRIVNGKDFRVGEVGFTLTSSELTR
ncbi:hypothetical protein MSAN_00864900 [Mycena sanguinolenta]|uniref:Uncharacterized protein n=1 Tax=Mycena sanguinolenta TaxID=230812 RepID=A0A8H7DCM8_9AGAR|nr:hypothetical protein MSAN_00864900 [Mycena sanguinolenta]